MKRFFEMFIMGAISVFLIFIGVVIFEEYKSKPEVLPGNMEIIQISSGKCVDPELNRPTNTGLIKITGYIGTNFVERHLDYLMKNKIKRVILRMHSPGGPVPEMFRIVSLIKNYQNHDGYVECQVFGGVYSAAFIVFITGDKRLIAEDSSCFGIHNIDSKMTVDHTSNISGIKYYMNAMYKHIAENSLMSEQEIRDLTKDKEWIYLTPKEMIKYGFADGFIK